MTVRRIKGVWTEEEVLAYLAISKDKLDMLRQKKELPYLSLDTVTRFYLEEDVRDWLVNRRVILGSETEKDGGYE